MLCSQASQHASIIILLLCIITSLLHRPLLLSIITHFSLQNLQMYCNLCTLWQQSESVSNFCLCFRVQSVSVWFNSDQVTEQSSTIWGMRVEKPSLWALDFKYFWKFKEKQGPSTFWDFCSGGVNSLQSRQCTRPAHAEFWTWAQLQVLQNSLGLMFMLRVQTLSARDSHWQNARKNKYRESSNIKAHASMHSLAQCHTKWWLRISAQNPCCHTHNDQP